MMDYDIATAHVDAAVTLTPGIEGPTISRCIATAGSQCGPWSRAPEPSG